MDQTIIINGILHQCFTHSTCSLDQEMYGCFKQVFPDEHFMIAAFSLYGRDCANEYQRQFADAVPKYAQEYAAFPVWFYKTENHELLLLLNQPEDGARKWIETVYAYFQERYSCPTYWGLSRSCRSLSEFVFARKEAVTALSFSFDDKNGGITAYHDALRFLPETGGDCLVSGEASQLLLKGIKTGDFALTDFILQVLKKENTPALMHKPDALISLNAGMLEMLQSLSSVRCDLSGELQHLNNTCLTMLNRPLQYFTSLAETCRSISAQLNGHKLSQKITFIDHVRQFIRDHFADASLSLSSTAQQFNVSEGYLSALFKETAGVCFTEYLEKCRIDQSCVLLAAGSKTILEISVCVGYNSVYSFRRAFKRSLNTSPSEYRASCQKKQH